jgi:hypothetical protein
VFNVPGNEALHRILAEWSELVPAQFDTYPLIDDAAAQALLAAQIPSR